MAFSADEGKLFFEDWLRTLSGAANLKHILDVGPGAGSYGEIIRRVIPDATIHAIEIFKPYVERFRLREKYDCIFIGDATKIKIDGYDLVILGDVLEHLPCDRAIRYWKYLKTRARFIWLCLPVNQFRPWFSGYAQPEIDWQENISEKHLCDWDYEKLIETLGPFLWQAPFRTVVVLIAEGNNA